MPIIWRFFIQQYFKVLCLVLGAFIAVLITARLDEIAHFASLGPESSYLFLFILYQIPYILPIALPIACLISAILLFKSLSVSHELTALRACGFSLRLLIAPLILMALVLAGLNFYIVSELSTNSHLKSYLLKNELRSINPLLLLNHKHLMRLKGVYFDAMGYSKMGEIASDIMIALPNQEQSALHLILAKKLEAHPDRFNSEGVTFLTSHQDQQFVENVGSITSPLEGFAPLLQKKVWTVNNDQLRLGLLWARLEEFKEKHVSQGLINAVYSEVFRRFSLAMAVITFTLMGISFGISINRQHTSKKIIVVLGLAALYIVCFFVAKGQDHVLPTTAILYFLPHAIIILLSLWILNRTGKGIETL